MRKDVILILWCVLIPIYLMLFSYSVVVNTVSLSAGQEEWMSYFNGGSVVTGNYTTAERAHMEDVKVVINKVVIVEEIVFVILLVLVLWLWKDRELLSKIGYYGGIATVSVLGIVLMLMLFSFNWVFRMFHAIFFPQGNWMFDYGSLLIQTFPLDFFVKLSGLIFGLALLLGFVMLVVGRYNYKRKK